MRKVWVIARRDFLAAVRSKAFVVTILFMPILMGISIGVQLLFAKMERAKTKRVAVLDRTPGQKLGASLKKMGDDLQKASKEIDRVKGLDPMIKDLLNININFETIEPKEDAERDAQIFELSQRLEKGDIEALVEIGADVAKVRGVFEKLLDVISVDENGLPTVNLGKIPDSQAVIVRSKGAGSLQVRQLVQTTLNQAVQKDRFEKKGIAPSEVEAMLQPLIFKNRSLVQRDASSGKFVERSEEATIISLILPGVLIALMFMAIMIGATPAMHGVVEEKSQRIAEVLLGSVTPFQLMAGKLIGVIGVSLSIAFVYMGGSYVLALYFGFASLIPTAMLAWFFPMLVLAMLIFGSLFIAVGAAATDIKDTQTLLMPIMMIACIPFFALGPIIQEPNGTIARVCSFFPFASPMLLTARQAVPPGVPTGELIACIAVVLLTTLACVWAAGRIFRIGILMQGKSPKFIELLKWAIRG
jgi:ABC-2 type transport system permease protein